MVKIGKMWLKLLAFATFSYSVVGSSPPNVVVILADDV